MSREAHLTLRLTVKGRKGGQNGHGRGRLGEERMKVGCSREDTLS